MVLSIQTKKAKEEIFNFSFQYISYFRADVLPNDIILVKY